MSIRALFFSILVLSLSACTAVKEGTEAVNNLSQEANRIHTQVKDTAEQIQTTVDTVNNITEEISKVAQ
jgi:hypothetical protein